MDEISLAGAVMMNVCVSITGSGTRVVVYAA